MTRLPWLSVQKIKIVELLYNAYWQQRTLRMKQYDRDTLRSGWLLCQFAESKFGSLVRLVLNGSTGGKMMMRGHLPSAPLGLATARQKRAIRKPMRENLVKKPGQWRHLICCHANYSYCNCKLKCDSPPHTHNYTRSSKHLVTWYSLISSLGDLYHCLRRKNCISSGDQLSILRILTHIHSYNYQ